MEQWQIGLFWTVILNWHLEAQRSFPWRHTRNPFHILTAEILLQQTNAELALPAYIEFIKQFPTAADLAEADIQDVINVIRPIGLVYRAKRLKQCALQLESRHRGRVPNSRQALLSLPGVGPYIADAVLCYGFDQPTIPIDTNVIRVMSRFFNLTSKKSRPRTDPELASAIAVHYPTPVSRQENLAVLDFAALICTARVPQCSACQLSGMCSWYGSHGN